MRGEARPDAATSIALELLRLADKREAA
jgi:hypothetical protein